MSLFNLCSTWTRMLSPSPLFIPLASVCVRRSLLVSRFICQKSCCPTLWCGAGITWWLPPPPHTENRERDREGSISQPSQSVSRAFNLTLDEWIRLKKPFSFSSSSLNWTNSVWCMHASSLPFPFSWWCLHACSIYGWLTNWRTAVCLRLLLVHTHISKWH